MSTSFFALLVVTTVVAVNALSILPPEKPGTCSRFISRRPCIEGEVEKGACVYDVQCPGAEKCCPSACGRTCQNICPAISEASCDLDCSQRGGLATDRNGCKVCACASCPRTKPVVYCIVDPCQATKCPAHPTAQCVSDYCGGCRANFFVAGREVKCGIEEPPTLNCNLVDCAVPECAYTVVPPGECCPVCTEPPTVATTATPTTAAPPATTAPRCSGAHEVYSLCSGGACQSTCAHQVNCLVCSPGCACEEGYIRLTENGECIPENLCPQQQCLANEEYTSCGGACQPTCSNGPVLCKACIPGCACKPGFIKSSPNGRCIPESICRNKQCRAKKPHSEYTRCGGVCQPTCANPIMICRACAPGCSCRRGFIQRYENGPCIRKYTCPRPYPPYPYY